MHCVTYSLFRNGAITWPTCTGRRISKPGTSHQNSTSVLEAPPPPILTSFHCDLAKLSRSSDPSTSPDDGPWMARPLTTPPLWLMVNPVPLLPTTPILHLNHRARTSLPRHHRPPSLRARGSRTFTNCYHPANEQRTLLESRSPILLPPPSPRSPPRPHRTICSAWISTTLLRQYSKTLLLLRHPRKMSRTTFFRSSRLQHPPRLPDLCGMPLCSNNHNSSSSSSVRPRAWQALKVLACGELARDGTTSLPLS